MKYFTLAIVLLAVCASVAFADKPSIKKRPVDPVPESVEELENFEKPAPKKPLLSALRPKPEPKPEPKPAPKPEPKPEPNPESGEKASEEEVKKPKRPLLPGINKKPIADDELPEVGKKEESSAELLEEVKEKNPPKKPLLGALKPKPTAEELDIMPPENIGQPEKLIENEPPTVDAKPKPRPALAKA